MRLLTVLFIVGLLGPFTSPVAAQTSPGQSQTPPGGGGNNTGPTTRAVEGIVAGTDGEPLAAAIVQLKDTKSLQVRSFITQKDGSYRFYGLSGDIQYEIRAGLNGASSPVKTISVFDTHKVIILNLKLKKKDEKGS